MNGISVVIPHYGSPEVGQGLLADLRRQQDCPDLQIIVVDDASPDPFPDTPGVEVVRRTVNGGFGSAVNAGVALAAHEILLVLNSDTRLGQRVVADLLAEAGPWMPALVAPAVVTDGRRELTGRRFPTARYQFVERISLLARWQHSRWWQRAIGQDLAAADARVVPVDWVAGVAMLLPTAEFRTVGGFDESYYMYVEEVDLQRRLRSRGIPSVYIGTVAVDHLGGASSDPARQTAWLTTSRLRYAKKWGGLPALRLALLTAATANVVTDMANQLRGRETRAWSRFREDIALALRHV